MTSKAKKFLITTESHERTVLRFESRKYYTATCSACSCSVEFLSIDEVSQLFGLRTKDVLGALSEALVHHIETVDGKLLICRRSVEDVQSRERRF